MYIDCQVALKALDLRSLKSHCAINCCLPIIQIKARDIKHCSVSGHSNVPSNECARLGSCAQEDTATLYVCIQFVELKNQVDDLLGRSLKCHALKGCIPSVRVPLIFLQMSSHDNTR